MDCHGRSNRRGHKNTITHSYQSFSTKFMLCNERFVPELSDYKWATKKYNGEDPGLFLSTRNEFSSSFVRSADGTEVLLRPCRWLFAVGPVTMGWKAHNSVSSTHSEIDNGGRPWCYAILGMFSTPWWRLWIARLLMSPLGHKIQERLKHQLTMQ